MWRGTGNKKMKEMLVILGLMGAAIVSSIVIACVIWGIVLLAKQIF